MEARLLESFKTWLRKQDRVLESFKCGSLQCDGYEKAESNLIEAKCSAGREYVRMAVGQLLDYSFQSKAELGELHKAILIPDRPSSDIEEWLSSMSISLIWLAARDVFVDNANGRFT